MVQSSPTSTAVLVLLVAAAQQVHSATPLAHPWDSVKDVMGMHGKWSSASLPTDSDVKFVADHYPMATLGTGCGGLINKTAGFTIEDSVQAVAARVKAANPSIKIGMYWRSDFALEIADCSAFSGVWAAHPEWRLLNDAGQPVDGTKYYFDYLNPSFRAFFAQVLVNVTRATVPGKPSLPLIDYIYVDGVPGESRVTEFQTGIGSKRSAQLVDAVYATYAEIQAHLDKAGHGQFAILNGMDTAWDAARHVSSGVPATMFDHWTILQFLNRTTGAFNEAMMDEAFSVAQSELVSNITVQYKGWVGPIIHQKDMYPPNMKTPTTPAELQAAALERFNSELAIFLLVAKTTDWWVYSWFWGFYDYVGGNPESSVPVDFFPQANCKLGAPLGQGKRVPGTWTYTRKFEHASVLVDLGNRTASRVDFVDC